MKTFIKPIYTILLIFLCQNLFAQLKSAAVVSVYTQGAKVSPEMAESIFRIVTTKTEQFNVLDKLDFNEIIEDSKIDISNCYGKKCLLSVGKAASVDKVITGSIESLGKKIVVTVKILNIETGDYDKVSVEEFINLDNEIQSMVSIVVNKALGIENTPEILNSLIYFNQPPEAPIAYLKNNGPRMGLSYVIGNTAKILAAPAPPSAAAAPESSSEPVPPPPYSLVFPPLPAPPCPAAALAAYPLFPLVEGFTIPLAP